MNIVIGSMMVTIILFVIMPIGALAQTGVTFHDKKLFLDDANGNSIGWNPNGSTTTFLIKDPTVNFRLSIVVVNVNSPNFNVCNLDWAVIGSFYLTCVNPPDEGSELHYMVINSEPADASGLPPSRTMQNQTDIQERERILQNQTSPQ